VIMNSLLNQRKGRNGKQGPRSAHSKTEKNRERGRKVEGQGVALGLEKRKGLRKSRRRERVRKITHPGKGSSSRFRGRGISDSSHWGKEESPFIKETYKSRVGEFGQDSHKKE